MNVTEQVGETTRSFFDVMRKEPLALALVLMNLLLITFLFYSQAQTLNQRKEALDQIVGWQSKTDQLMASCVSKEVVDTIVTALERQLSEMRRQLDGHVPESVPLPPARPQ